MSASEQPLDAEHGWNLTDLYVAPDDPAVSADLENPSKATPGIFGPNTRERRLRFWTRRNSFGR